MYCKETTPLAEISWFTQDGKIESSLLTTACGWIKKGNEFSNNKLGLSLELIVTKEAKETRVEVPREKLCECGENRFHSLVIMPGMLGGNEGEKRSLLIPCDTGILCHTKGKETAEYSIPGFFWRDWQKYMVNMMVIGVIGDNQSIAAIIDEAKFNVEFRLRTNYGSEHRYSIDPLFTLRESIDHDLIQESPVLIYKKLQGDIASIARWYRDYLIKKQNLLTLAEKATIDPRLDYASKAISMRMRMAAKPVPSPIAEQTKDNQPPLKVFMTFDDVSAVADECARQGVGPIDFTFVGWNYGGHDGAFPQVFPVEKALGGEERMLGAIKNIQSHAYQVGVHDNYIDVYTIADNLNRDDVMKNHDGSEEKGELWGGGRAYICCPLRAKEHYAPRTLKAMQRFGLNGAYYVDVISLINMRECYDPKHPVSRSKNAECYKDILQMQHELTGISMSEGARDWSFPELDRTYSIGNCSDPQDELPYADKEVPLFPLAFHGILIYNSFRIGINAMPGDELYLRNIAYGGIPTLYYHHLFSPFCTPENGWTEDLTFETPEKLRKDVSAIKRITDDVAKFNHLRFSFMKDFIRISPTLTQTLYENGSSVYVNYADVVAITSDGYKIPARDFVVISKNDKKQYKSKISKIEVCSI